MYNHFNDGFGFNGYYTNPAEIERHNQHVRDVFEMSSLSQALGEISGQSVASGYSYPPAQDSSRSYLNEQPVAWGTSYQENDFGQGSSSAYRSAESWTAPNTGGSTYYSSQESGGFFSALGSFFGMPASVEDSCYQQTEYREVRPSVFFPQASSNTYDYGAFQQPVSNSGYGYTNPPMHQPSEPFNVDVYHHSQGVSAYSSLPSGQEPSQSANTSSSTSSSAASSPARSAVHVYEVEIPKVKGATAGMIEDWKDITKNVIQLVDDRSVVKEAMKNLFILYVASPTFRATVERLREEGPVKVRTMNAHEESHLPTAAYDPTTNTVIINAETVYYKNQALACLAFELTNAYFQRNFSEVYEKAPNMTAREFGEAMERVEMNTANRVHEYQMEARSLLKKYGFDDPRPWMTSRVAFIHPKVQKVLAKVGVRGQLVPMFKNEKKALSWQRFKGHTEHYEKYHRARFPENNAD